MLLMAVVAGRLLPTGRNQVEGTAVVNVVHHAGRRRIRYSRRSGPFR